MNRKLLSLIGVLATIAIIISTLSTTAEAPLDSSRISGTDFMPFEEIPVFALGDGAAVLGCDSGQKIVPYEELPLELKQWDAICQIRRPCYLPENIFIDGKGNAFEVAEDGRRIPLPEDWREPCKAWAFMPGSGWGQKIVPYEELPLELKQWDAICEANRPAWAYDRHPSDPIPFDVPTKNLIEIEVIDWDANENGEAVDMSELTNCIDLYTNGGYNPQFDTDFDGPPIDIDDLLTWVNQYIGFEPGEYSTMWNNVRDAYAKLLDWPDPISWSCFINGVDPDEVWRFTGTDSEYGGDVGWNRVIDHWPLENTYTCQEFSTDTEVGTYKAIGYGWFVRGYHIKDPNNPEDYDHNFIMFWKGNKDFNWTNLHNWGFVEPQTGEVIADAGADNVGYAYRANYICFPRLTSGGQLYEYMLVVDWNAKTVSYSAEGLVTEIGYEAEPIPEKFNPWLS